MKLTFKDEVGEQGVIENLLNMQHSGYSQVLVLLSLYALFNHWKLDKLVYYKNLLEEE